MKRQFLTSDLYDQFEHACSSCETQFKQFGGRRSFCGRIRTVKCIADNVLIRRMLETPSKGEVLVIDGGGYLGSALVGDVIAGLGANNGWAGVIVYGAVRDSRALAKIDLGIKALGTNPKKGYKNATGQTDIIISFGRVSFIPENWVYSDDDGILVSGEKIV